MTFGLLRILGMFFFIFLHRAAASYDDLYLRYPNFLTPAGVLASLRAEGPLRETSSSSSPLQKLTSTSNSMLLS